MFDVFIDAHSFGNAAASNSERLTDKAPNTVTSTSHTDGHIDANASINADASINTDAAFATDTAYNANADTPCGLDSINAPDALCILNSNNGTITHRRSGHGLYQASIW